MQFSEIYYEPQKTRRTVKELKKKPQTHVPVQMERGGEVLSAEALANEMNKYFLASRNFDGAASKYFERYIDRNLADTMFSNPTSPEKISSLICSLGNKLSSGYDGIRTVPIKAIADVICNVLCHVANIVLTTCIFPKKMKIARVVVLSKGSTVKYLGKYELIAVLPLFSRILEKDINSKITSHF